MGLDIYAGTLTRYYSHNWKTVVLQWAEENGYTFNRITPDGEPADNEEELSPAEVLAAVENWRDQILSAISQPGQPPYAPWIEDNEKPYYTDKPDWDAFGAMLLVAACHTYEEPVPPTVEKDWIFGEHPLVARHCGEKRKLVFLFLRKKAGWKILYRGGGRPASGRAFYRKSDSPPHAGSCGGGRGKREPGDRSVGLYRRGRHPLSVIRKRSAGPCETGRNHDGYLSGNHAAAGGAYGFPGGGNGVETRRPEIGRAHV